MDAERLKGATFANGDRATGDYYEEGGRTWFGAVDAQGRSYETDEMPAIRLSLTVTQFVGGWSGPQVREYFSGQKTLA